MIKIRLSRVGRKNQPLFRIVVTPHTAPAKSGFIQIIGTYNPTTKKVEVDKKAVEEWIAKGAQLSDTVNNIFVTNKIIKGESVKTSRKPRKKPKKIEKGEKPVKKAEAKSEPKEESTKKAEPEKKEQKKPEKQAEAKPAKKKE